MAKRELSSTLKNLKFMQRAAPKEEKPTEEEGIRPDGNFVSVCSALQKCVVVTEGDPWPGAMKGRMSFLNFNPSIDKLNKDGAEKHQLELPATSSSGQRRTLGRENGQAQNGASESLDVKMANSDSDGESKRKQPEVTSETNYPSNLQKSNQGKPHSSPSGSRSSQKKAKQDKLDWNLLRPPKSQGRKE